MIEQEEGNPISILFMVITSVIVMGFLLLISGTMMDKILNVFGDIIQPNLGTWGSSMYDEIVTKMAHWMFIIPGFIIIVFLVWGIKSVIKKQTYGRKDDEFLNGNL